MTAGRQLTTALLVLASGMRISAEEPLGLLSVDRHRQVVGMPGETEIAASPEGQQILIGTNHPQDAAPATLDRRTVFFSINSGETFEASTLNETTRTFSLKNHRDPTVARGGSGDGKPLRRQGRPFHGWRPVAHSNRQRGRKLPGLLWGVGRRLQHRPTASGGRLAQARPR